MLSGVLVSRVESPARLPGVHPTNPLGDPMMNRIRTRIESKRAAEQTRSFYVWRPGSGGN